MKEIKMESIMDVLDSWEQERVRLQAVADAVQDLLGPLRVLLEALQVLNSTQDVPSPDEDRGVRDPRSPGEQEVGGEACR